MVDWCKKINASSGLTLASMQGRECQTLPCYDFCPYVDKEKGKE